MAKANTSIYHFNRGLISRLALARVDIKRTAFSAEQMTNWMPRVLGSMMLRPGLGYLGAVSSLAPPKFIPFIFATDDTALIEVCGGKMRVWRQDALITRNTVASAVTNGNFDTNLTGWTDNDEGGAASTWATGGYMQLVGTGTNAAIRDQQVTVSGADVGVEHALRIVIQRGPVTVRIGSTSGGDEYVAETDLATGIHSLAFTPTGNFFIRFQSRLRRLTLVDSCNVEAAGVMEIAVPWGSTDVPRLRWDQSADVIFVACKNFQQRRIERRAARSWSVVLYYANDGPFRTENLGPITIAPSGLNGNVTLTASAPLFKSTQVGGLIKIRSTGQRVTASIAAENTFTNPILVVGVGESRRFAIVVAGVFTATVTLQRSIGVVGNWEDVATYAAVFDDTFNDGLDNQEIYYRIGIKTGDYVGGTAVVTLTYTLGSITGVARITDFTSNLVVGSEVLQDFGGTDASDLWSEGSWSDRRGWPSAVAFDQGRLDFSGKNGFWASISDAFDSFDPDFEGDAGPINRTVGSGPVDDVNWLLPLQRLILGASGAEHVIRSSALDEPITPTNFNIKPSTTLGSAPVAAVKIDQRGVFVQRGGSRVYELALGDYAYDATDLTALVPEVGEPSIVSIGVQRQPDTRIHCVRSDGLVAVAVLDRVENVLSWQLVETDGTVTDVAVLPGTTEDAVYYAVVRSTGATGVISLAVTPGSGYTERPTLSFSGGGGANAAATVDLTLVSATVAAAGSGYVAGEIVPLVGGSVVSPASIHILTVDGGGGVLTIAVNAGGDYVTLPTNAVATSGGSGTGFTVTATWGLGAATIVNTGGSYETAPSVLISGGGAGTGGAITATVANSTSQGQYLEKWALESECRGGTLNKQADAFVVYDGNSPVIITGGFVSSVSVAPGRGYPTPPSVAFAGGGGIGAAATAYLAIIGPVLNLFTTFGSTGSGYSPGDILTLTGGTFTRPAMFKVNVTFGPGIIQSNSVTIVDGGAYSVLPPHTAPLSGGTGSGAVMTIVQDYVGVGEVVVTTGGSGYTAPPTVTLVGTPATTDPAFPPVVATATAGITASTVTDPNAVTLIPGLGHLEGREVVVWADGADLSPETDGVQRTYTVQGGIVGVDVAVSNAVIGLPYQGTWVSTKLANASPQGSTLNQRKKITELGIIALDMHQKGLKFGSSLDNLNQLPSVEAGADVPDDRVWLGYDGDMIEFPGEWSTDSRLWLVANAPRPCTLLAATMAIEEHPKS